MLVSGNGSKVEQGDKAFAEKNYNQALTYYLKALEEKPDDPQLLQKIGASYYKIRDCPNAITYLTRAKDLAPNDKEILFTLGLIYFQSGEKMKALGIYNELKKIHLDKAESLYKMMYS